MADQVLPHMWRPGRRKWQINDETAAGWIESGWHALCPSVKLP
jgi:hypothetical protein